MDTIQHNISLADKNWFKTGGNARYFTSPSDEIEFQHALLFAQKHNLAIFILGDGANILISDEGFNGLVIQPHLKKISIIKNDAEHVFVQAGSGTLLSDLITFCLENNISGLEEFSGIPGTVGGSVYINIHYFQFLLSHFLTEATIIEKNTGTIKTVSHEWFQFGYNTSKLQENKHYLLDATFKVQKVSAIQSAFAQGRSLEIMRHRAQRYPKNNTCGSFFRNFNDNEVSLVSNGKKLTFIAYYLDKIGIKGTLQHGNAIVSYQHANMIVNQGNATSNDIIAIARDMQKLVHNQFGILPQPECRLIGFKPYPLLY